VSCQGRCDELFRVKFMTTISTQLCVDSVREIIREIATHRLRDHGASADETSMRVAELFAESIRRYADQVEDIFLRVLTEERKR
jgi:hypothetical protein